MNIEILQDHAPYKEGDVVDVSDEVGNALIAEGIAKLSDEVKEENDDEANAEKTKKVLKTFENSVEKTLNSKVNEITEKVTKNLEKKLGHGFAVSADPLDATFGFKNRADWLSSFYAANKGNEDHANRMKTYKQKMGNFVETQVTTKLTNYVSAGVDTALMPYQFSQDIWNPEKDQAAWFNDCLQRKTDRQSYNAKVFDDTTRANEVVNGFRGYWLDEAAQITDTKPATADRAMKLRKLCYLVPVTDEMKYSAYNVGEIISNELPAAIRYKLNSALFNGAGSGSYEPVGIATSGNGGLITVTRNTATRVIYTDLTNMIKRAHMPNGLGKYKFYISQSVLPEFIGMKWPNDSGTIPAFNTLQNAWTGGAAMGISLVGVPFVVVDSLPALGFKGDVVLSDLSAYYCLRPMQEETRIDSSIHFYFDKAVDCIRVITYADFGPTRTAAMTTKSGNPTTVSEHITLSTYT